MTVRIGLREANQKFSQTIKAVKAGQEVVLTERGRPVALIKPLGRPKQPDAALRHLEATGLLRPPQRRGRLQPWSPRQIKGQPISETLREERERR